MLLKEKKTSLSWQKPYLKAMVDALSPSGDVLEVGYGDGYAAKCIQGYRPTSHIIIEPDPETAKKAKRWAKNHPKVTIIEDRWEKTLPKLGIFDAIFFHPSVASKKEEEEPVYFEDAVAALRKGDELLKGIHQDLPELTSLRYSDQDLEDLYIYTPPEERRDLTRFLNELEKNGQITPAQKKDFLQRKNLSDEATSPQVHRFEEIQDFALAFLEQCLHNHMRVGSRFTCLSMNPTSKYEIPQFFEKIITNPNLDFQEDLIPIKSSQDYPFDHALVIKIEKQL